MQRLMGIGTWAPARGAAGRRAGRQGAGPPPRPPRGPLAQRLAGGSGNNHRHRAIRIASGELPERRWRRSRSCFRPGSSSTSSSDAVRRRQQQPAVLLRPGRAAGRMRGQGGAVLRTAMRARAVLRLPSAADAACLMIRAEQSEGGQRQLRATQPAFRRSRVGVGTARRRGWLKEWSCLAPSSRLTRPSSRLHRLPVRDTCIRNRHLSASDLL